MSKVRIVLGLLVLLSPVLLDSVYAQPRICMTEPGNCAKLAAKIASVPIAIVPGGGAIHIEADDQNGNRLDPMLFTWAIPAGTNIGIMKDATGWLLSAPLNAVSGSYTIPVQYNPNNALSPSATIVVGETITSIHIIVSP